ncbi:gamma-glutamylcyclotransferase family protein [Desulfosporosinus sp. SYSU MS00001]|uniref:gamma-glutamylcyclotransferase family protein n=1 Tax=Desulfosporosinus sp. SYSU MS00001 TaxID=3416284 RepID=UPI003CF40598
MAKRKSSKKLYFAYGSCMDYEGRVTTDGYADDFSFQGIAQLNDYEFRLNKIASDQMHAYANIRKKSSSVVYGYLFEISNRAEIYLDRREGYPSHYTKKSVTVYLDGKEYTNVLVYVAKSNRVCQVQLPVSSSYFHELLRGSEQLPEPYRTNFRSYLKDCYRGQLYHYSDENTAFIQSNPEFYSLTRDMTLFLGNDNQLAENMQISPEMFRIMVKLTEMAFRNELDLGHLIPRELLKKLNHEFQSKKELLNS